MKNTSKLPNRVIPVLCMAGTAYAAPILLHPFVLPPLTELLD